MAMTGGTSKLVKQTTVKIDGKLYYIRLYVYYRVESDYRNNRSIIYTGMYVNNTCNIGSWTDFYGSYVGTTGNAFVGTTPYIKKNTYYWLTENQYFTVNHNTTGTTDATIYWKWGVNSTWGSMVNPSGSFTISLPALKSAVTTPTYIEASPKLFNNAIDIVWGGSQSGVNNDIVGYNLEYQVYSNGAWQNWYHLTRIDTTLGNGKYTIQNASAYVNRGDYIRFSVQALAQDSNYNSGWLNSADIQRAPYTECGEPKTFRVVAQPVLKNDNFENIVQFNWDSATGGTNNYINGYNIEYTITSNQGTSWGKYYIYKTISTTKNNYQFTVDISSLVPKGEKIQFRIQTKGTAGEGYNSKWVWSEILTRTTKTRCLTPATIDLTANGKAYYAQSIINKNFFEDEIVLKWEASIAGDNVQIINYETQYQIGTKLKDSEDIKWENWQLYKMLPINIAGTNFSVKEFANIERGKCIKFRVRAIADDDDFNSDFKESNIINRNILPYPLLEDVIVYDSEYSKIGRPSGLIFSWIATDDDDKENMEHMRYEIYGRYTTQMGTQWTPWNNIGSVSFWMGQGFDDRITISMSGETLDGIFINNGNFLTMSNGADSQQSLFNFYQSIGNNEKLELIIVPIDMFCTQSLIDNIKSRSVVLKISRYDITGVAFGKDGRWVNCQIFVGANNNWVEQTVLCGIKDAWVEVDDGSI